MLSLKTTDAICPFIGKLDAWAVCFENSIVKAMVAARI